MPIASFFTFMELLNQSGAAVGFDSLEIIVDFPGSSEVPKAEPYGFLRKGSESLLCSLRSACRNGS